MPATDHIFDAILNGKPNPALEATQEAVKQGTSPSEIINGHMIRAMEEIGNRFERGQAFVPELLMAAQAMKKCLEFLKPMMTDGISTSLGKVILGTVEGDLHDIGKNLVASMLEGCGFEIINLGTNVRSEQFISAINEHRPDILGMSALLTTTMPAMKKVIDSLIESGLRNHVKVMIGGAPVTEEFAQSIGADGYSANANTAVALARSLIM